MTEALISQLTRIPSLRVIARTSIMRFRDSDLSITEIARQLRATHIVEGSVLRADKRIRIGVQLIEADTDRYLWTQDYERDVEDVLSLQNELAQAIVSNLKARVGGTLLEDFSGYERKVDPAHYDLLLRTEYLFWQGNPADIMKAMALTRQMIAEHTALARDYALLSLGHRQLMLFGVQSGKSLLEEHCLAGLKAIELDDALAISHLALASAESWNWNWAGAEKAICRAIELEPGNWWPHQQYATICLFAQGRLDEARENCRSPLTLIRFPSGHSGISASCTS